jgi:hypothetical protein
MEKNLILARADSENEDFTGKTGEVIQQALDYLSKRIEKKCDINCAQCARDFSKNFGSINYSARVQRTQREKVCVCARVSVTVELKTTQFTIS